MDEKTAWEHFAETGRVADYLQYCRSKEVLPHNEWKNLSSEESYDKNTGTDFKGAECR